MMKCRECGAEMYLDDTDRINKNSRDEYWNCPKCQTSCIVDIRCGFKIAENWHSENNGEVKNIYVDTLGGK